MSIDNYSTPSIPISSHQNGTGISLEHHLYPAYETPEHTLPEHHICLYVGNPLTYEQVIKGKLRSHHCIYGDMVLYPAGLTQKLSWNKDAEIIELNINPALIIQAASDLPQSDSIELIPQYALRDALIQQLLFALLGELQSHFGNNLYIESLHQTLCWHLLRHYSTSSAIDINCSKDSLSPVLHRRLDEYIQSNLSQNITLAKMARVLNMSTSHLTKLFKQSQGISLYQYVIVCRVAKAKQLLKNSKIAIAQIATQVGFADQSHLTYHFKRHVGVTPKTFRQL